jgi:hypothetical protein
MIEDVEEVDESAYYAVSYQQIVDKANRLQAYVDSAMYILDIVNKSEDLETVKEKINRYATKLMMSRYSVAFKRIERDMVFV